MFQLKTSSDYVVPEHLRSNTRQKRRKISLLTVEIYEKKKMFNEKVKRARDEKIKIREYTLGVTEELATLQLGLISYNNIISYNLTFEASLLAQIKDLQC